MNTGMIPVRYAKALLEFAEEKGRAQEVYTEMIAVANGFEREASLRQVLDNPVLSTAVKANIIRSATGKSNPGEVFERFVTLILQNRRERYLQLISLMYLDLYRKKNHISIGKLETAVAVTPEAEQRIADMIATQTKGTAELKTVVKPELIGGFVFEMNCERLDASVATQLRNVKQQFIEKNKRIV